MTTPVDVTILGGGPTGLFAAFYAGLRGASCAIVDSMPALGGRLTAVYPEKAIYDVAGFPKVLARDLVDNLVAQAMAYSPQVLLNHVARDLERLPDGTYHIHFEHGGTLHTRSLVICAGVGAYNPKKHTAPGAQEYQGKGVDYAVLQKDLFSQKKVVVAGGGDSAIDWALELAPVAAHVVLVHRSEKFRAHGANVAKLQGSGVEVRTNWEISAFHGDGTALRSIELTHTLTGEQDSLNLDTCLVMFGFNSSLGELKNWGIHISPKGGIAVNERMETNMPGVYAAGDVADYGAKLKLIATGFSEAAIAVNFAMTYLNPKEKPQPLHSTTIMELKEKKAARVSPATT